jgi:hypothetical protein
LILLIAVFKLLTSVANSSLVAKLEIGIVTSPLCPFTVLTILFGNVGILSVTTPVCPFIEFTI